MWVKLNGGDPVHATDARDTYLAMWRSLSLSDLGRIKSLKMQKLGQGYAVLCGMQDACHAESEASQSPRPALQVALAFEIESTATPFNGVGEGQ